MTTTKIRHVLLVAVTLLGVAVAVPVGPTGAAEFIGVSKKPLSIEVNKGALLRLSRPAKTIFIADPNVADIQIKSPRLVYITAKQPGETSLYAVDGGDRVILNRRISVSHNISRLLASFRHLFPNSRIDIRSVDGAMVLHGSVATASDAEDVRDIAAKMLNGTKNLINKISVSEPNQVHLRVRIAEVSRTVLKEFGINWEGVIRSGNFFFGQGIGRDIIGSSAFLDERAFSSASDISILTRKDPSVIAGGYDNSRSGLSALIDALDQEQLITILAEPNLTAVSGETATFLAGGEFPIIIPKSDTSVIIEFKEFGVSLSFTPTLINGTTINLKVKPEVSQLTTTGAVEFAGFSVPGLTTRRAETTVELGSGQSFAIAGLLQNNITRDLNRFPGLAEVPILGALFRSDKFKRNESELVIIVTPYVVRPVSHQRLALPTDGLTPPTDTDRLLHGRLYRPTLGRHPNGPNGRGATGLVGPVGFMLD